MFEEIINWWLNKDYGVTIPPSALERDDSDYDAYRLTSTALDFIRNTRHKIGIHSIGNHPGSPIIIWFLRKKDAAKFIIAFEGSKAMTVSSFQYYSEE